MKPRRFWNAIRPSVSGITDPAASFSTPNITITATTGVNLSSGRFGAAISVNGGASLYPATRSDFFGCWDKNGSNRIGAVVPRANAICVGAP